MIRDFIFGMTEFRRVKNHQKIFCWNIKMLLTNSGNCFSSSPNLFLPFSNSGTHEPNQQQIDPFQITKDMIHLNNTKTLKAHGDPCQVILDLACQIAILTNRNDNTIPSTNATGNTVWAQNSTTGADGCFADPFPSSASTPFSQLPFHRFRGSLYNVVWEWFWLKDYQIYLKECVWAHGSGRAQKDQERDLIDQPHLPSLVPRGDLLQWPRR